MSIDLESGHGHGHDEGHGGGHGHEEGHGHGHAAAGPLLPRALADAYVAQLVELDPILATDLGLPEGQDRLPDLSPGGDEARAALKRRTLTALAEAETLPGAQDELERRCARLLRERLGAELAVHDAGEHLRAIGTLSSPLQRLRGSFTLMPTDTEADWDVVASRLHAVPAAVETYRQSLEAGLAQGLPAGPTQVRAVLEQIETWLGTPSGQGRDSWFAQFEADGPESRTARLESAARAATDAFGRLREWLLEDYRPGVLRDGKDPVGAERYARWASYWTGADLDLEATYAWGWQEYARLHAELRRQAELVLPGATPAQARADLSAQGEAIEGVEQIRVWLQELMDSTIAAVDGVHFDLAGPVRRVEAMIAPAGSAAAAYYTEPSTDFARPGRTWLPTLGATRFPLWNLATTWYHEGVPGHHLQLAQWTYVAPQLSRYQTTAGGVSANIEGWALYAERLMDELGFLTDPGRRLGYLDEQMARAIRVVIDIGMHLELPIPQEQGTPEPFAPGQVWTPELAREFMGANSGHSAAFVASEIVRYLGMPGQAIGYKLGERAWLEGRERARAARGEAFDLKAWHMAALSQGSLGLDDLVAELAVL